MRYYYTKNMIAGKKYELIKASTKEQAIAFAKFLGTTLAGDLFTTTPDHDNMVMVTCPVNFGI